MAYEQKIIDENDIRNGDVVISTGGNFQTEEDGEIGQIYDTLDNRFAEQAILVEIQA